MINDGGDAMRGEQAAVDTTDILKDYIPRKELARQLGYTEKTLIRWELDQKGPPITRLGRKVLYFRESVEKWLRDQERRWGTNAD